MAIVDDMIMANTRFKSVVDPMIASQIFGTLLDKLEPCNMADLIVSIYEVAHEREFVTALGLSYELDPNDTGSPTPDETRAALEALVNMDMMEKVLNDDHVLDRYRVVIGASVLAVGG